MISNSVYAYCCEDLSKIENYDKAIADETQTWQCHHKAEILPCGNYSVPILIKYGLYFHRPANELIFLTFANHNRIHNSQGGRGKKMGLSNKGRKTWLGRHHTEDTKKKIRAKCKGHTPWNKGKKGIYSKETLQRMSNKAKNRKHSEETKKKIGKKITEHNLKQNISARFKGLLYWNNGKINRRARECPEGFVKGKLTKI